MKKLYLFFVMLLFVFTTCKKPSNENNTGWADEDLTFYNNVIALQKKAGESYITWSKTMDTLAVLNQLQQFFISNPSVTTATKSSQGIAVQYSNGMRGGIFLYPQDEPGEGSLKKGLPVGLPNSYPPKESRVNNKKAIFLNPHYWERNVYADKIIQHYNSCLPAAGYTLSDVYKNDDATLEKFSKLSGYGIIHIYSHGWAWPESKNIQDVYLLTGELADDKTSAQYQAEIKSGEIVICETHDPSPFGVGLMVPIYFINEKFIASHNDFGKDTVLFYGGFCYSNLGQWTQLSTKFANGAYFGFDWAVRTSRNSEWAISLVDSLSNTEKAIPYNTEGWFQGSNLPKSYYSKENEKTVSIHYTGDAGLTLLEEKHSVVETSGTTNITQTTATTGGTVKIAGNNIISARGICLSIISNINISNSQVIPSGSGTGSFVVNLTSLTPNTKYYFKAYATSIAGTEYGRLGSFTTLPPPHLDFTLTTDSVKDIAKTTARSGGVFINPNQATVKALGTCWSIVPNPTILDAHTTTTASLTFYSYLTGLSENTTYYIRAYGISDTDTVYGNQLSFTTPLYSIGQSYGGGIIFYIDSTAKHGLIAAPSDQSIDAKWGCYLGNLSLLIGGTSKDFGTGQANTNAIIAGCNEAGTAARICDELILNGYSDWFLPSFSELTLMYRYEKEIGGFDNSPKFWSSSEYNNQSAFAKEFSGQGSSAIQKDSKIHVRAVRAF
jgi:hypothetical protein